jgi:hypothetical protein
MSQRSPEPKGFKKSNGSRSSEKAEHDVTQSAVSRDWAGANGILIVSDEAASTATDSIIAGRIRVGVIAAT